MVAWLATGNGAFWWLGWCHGGEGLGILVVRGTWEEIQGCLVQRTWVVSFRRREGDHSYAWFCFWLRNYIWLFVVFWFGLYFLGFLWLWSNIQLDSKFIFGSKILALGGFDWDWSLEKSPPPLPPFFFFEFWLEIGCRFLVIYIIYDRNNSIMPRQ